jgi:hypothetical protein
MKYVWLGRVKLKHPLDATCMPPGLDHLWYIDHILEHRHARRLRATEDAGDRQLWQGDAGTAQGIQNPLCHEDIRQAESKSPSISLHPWITESS